MDHGAMKALLDRCAASWDEFWFRSQTPVDLAVCRIIYYLGVYWVLYSGVPPMTVDEVTFAATPAALHWPLGVFKYLPIAAPETLLALHWILQVALIAAAVGFATRLAQVVTGVL